MKKSSVWRALKLGALFALPFLAQPLTGSAEAQVPAGPRTIGMSGVVPDLKNVEINTGNVYRGTVGNRPINVDDVHIDRDWGWNNGYNGCCYHPVAAGVAAAAVTAAAIGSTVYTLPSDCVSTIVNGVTYMQCGSTWYEPQFYGGDASYTVVSPP